MTCKNAKDFASAVKANEEYIEIEGDFANKVLRIKATGKLSWALCIASLTVAVTLYLTAPEAAVITAPAGGAGGVISFTGGVAATTVAATTLGTATMTAITIGVAAGGAGILNTIRDKYKIVSKRDKYLKLVRK